MRQGEVMAVAPLNTNPCWPEGYIAVLREASAIEKTIPYHVAWVRRFFFQFPGRRRRSHPPVGAGLKQRFHGAHNSRGGI